MRPKGFTTERYLRDLQEAAATRAAVARAEARDRPPPREDDAAMFGAADQHLVTGRRTGDFPGGTADLRWDFTVAGGRITRLVVAP
jgi:hypothetical protein